MFFFVLLTVHLSIISVINQLNAQNSYFIISLLYTSLCFERYVLIIRKSKVYSVIQKYELNFVSLHFAFTQTAYLLKLVNPTTNALPRWRLNVETKTKRTLHSSRRLSFNEPTNAKKILCCIVAILLSTDAAARL